MVEEAAESLVKGEGSEYLGNYLEKIKEIKEGLSVREESYDEFLKSYVGTYDFN